jgi:kynurenine formamidase
MTAGGESGKGNGREGGVRVIDISAPMRCGEGVACEVPAELPVYCGYACEEYRFSFRSHLGCYFETSAHLLRGGTMTSDVPVARLCLPAMVARLDAGRGGAIESDEIAAALHEPIRRRRCRDTGSATSAQTAPCQRW